MNARHPTRLARAIALACEPLPARLAPSGAAPGFSPPDLDYEAYAVLHAAEMAAWGDASAYSAYIHSSAATYEIEAGIVYDRALQFPGAIVTAPEPAVAPTERLRLTLEDFLRSLGDPAD